MSFGMVQNVFNILNTYVLVESNCKKNSKNTCLTLALFLALEKDPLFRIKALVAYAFSLTTVFDFLFAGSDGDREGGFSDYF